MIHKHRLMPALTLGLSGCGQQSEKDATPDEPREDADPLASIDLSNPSSFARADEPFYISFYELGLGTQAAQSRNLGAKLDDASIPSQVIDRSGDGQADGLLSLIELAPSESKKLIIAPDQSGASSDKRTQAEISRKTGGQWQEDPENPGKYVDQGGDKDYDETRYAAPWTDYRANLERMLKDIRGASSRGQSRAFGGPQLLNPADACGSRY